jgi:hypothetical protein
MGHKGHPTTLETLRYMRQHPGLTMHYTDIAKEISISPEYVSAALVRMNATHPEFGVRRVASGQYKYSPADEVFANQRPPVEPIGKMYEKVGVTKNGAIVIKDEDGVLWMIQEMLLWDGVNAVSARTIAVLAQRLMTLARSRCGRLRAGIPVITGRLALDMHLLRVRLGVDGSGRITRALSMGSGTARNAIRRDPRRITVS